MMPLSPLIGFPEPSLATGKSVTAFSTAASRGKLPLTVYRVGHIITFDGDDVATWDAAGFPASPDWETVQCDDGAYVGPDPQQLPKTQPNSFRPGDLPS